MEKKMTCASVWSAITGAGQRDKERKKETTKCYKVNSSKTKKHIDTLSGRYQRSGNGNGVHMGLQLVDDAAVVLAGLITLVSLLIMDDDDRCITIVL